MWCRAFCLRQRMRPSNPSAWIPADGLPAAGARPRISEIYTALTHSGVTLAIVLGRLIAQEIADATPAAMLEPYRPERFRRATQH